MGPDEELKRTEVPQSYQHPPTDSHATRRRNGGLSWMNTPILADASDDMQFNHSTINTPPAEPSLLRENWHTTQPTTREDEERVGAKRREAQLSQEAYSQTGTTASPDYFSVKQDEKKHDELHPHRSPMSPRSDTNWSNLGPDENPLTPTTPKISGRDQRRNTNMGILSPQAPTYTANDYAPVPQAAKGDTWHYSLCSCAEPAICTTSLFCPCIVYGRVQYRLNMKSDQKDATNLLGYKRTNGSCLAWSFLCGISGILSGIQKSRVRRVYEMGPGSGNLLSDCLSGCCCCCCVLAQNEKEFQHRESQTQRGPGGRQEGYVPPGGMTFSPPPR